MKLIIIDDDQQREAAYVCLVELINKDPKQTLNIEVQYCFTTSDALAALREVRGHFVVLLDMILDGWHDHGLIHDMIVQLEAPVIAISGQFDDRQATSVYFNLSSRKRLPIPIIHYSAIARLTENRQLSDKIQPIEETQDTFRTYVGFLLNNTELPGISPEHDLKIIHLTDTHFDVGLSGQRHLSQIGYALEGENLQGDFLCVSGDVIDKGGSQSTDIASKWLQGCFSNRWIRPSVNLSLPSNHIFLCPGNHDFVNPLGNAVKDLWTYGISPFLKLHEELTGWRVPRESYPGYRTSARFSGYGIHFLEIWSEAYGSDSAAPFVTSKLFDEILTSMSNALRASTRDGDLLVVLTHRFTPESDHLFSEQLRQQLGSFALLRVLVLCGHRHQNDFTPNHLSPNILKIEGSTLSEIQKRSNKLSEFRAITLKRSDGRVIDVKVDSFENRDTGWKITRDTKFFTWKNARWFEAPMT